MGWGKEKSILIEKYIVLFERHPVANCSKTVMIFCRKQRENNNRGVEREIPNVVSVCNRLMDLSDQHISCCDPDIRSV